MKIIVLMGKTASGKDTVARYLYSEYGIQPIISYTTRDKRESEIDGREHWFVDDKKMDELLEDKENLLAFMENPKTGRRYCASTQGLNKDTTYLYIINPIAYERMIRDNPDLDTIVIFCDLPEDEIIKRAEERGDDPDIVKARLDDERDEFDSFRKNHFEDVKDKSDENSNLYILSTIDKKETVQKMVSFILSNAGIK